MQLEYKSVPFLIDTANTKEIIRDNGTYGIIKGYASTFDKDRGGDQILPGAFKKSLKQFKRDSRQIRMYFQHSHLDVIGGFPISGVKEDDTGLLVTGEINLDVQKGREAYSLAKQGVLTDFSIGYTVDAEEWEKDTRILKEVTLWEVSIVSEPMNKNANITEVKTVMPFSNLPLADLDEEWDADAADERIRVFTKSDDEPSDSYRKAFMWFDSSNQDNFTAYKLPFVDVIEDSLKAIPKAIFSIAGILQGARGGTSISEDDQQKIVNVVNKYYAKLGMDSPLNKSNFPQIESIGDVENLLKGFGLTGSQRKILISKIKEFSANSRDDCTSSTTESSVDESLNSTSPDAREEHGQLDIEQLNADLDNLINKFR